MARLRDLLTKAENIVRGAVGAPKAFTRDQAVAWVKHNTKGRIFGLNFIKTRSNNALRIMTCRWGVRGKRGGKLPYDADQKRLLILYDMKIREHRAAAYEGLRGILIGGKYHPVR